MREFELQKMKESETVKDYTDKSLGIANKIRLLGGDFANSRIVENFLVTVPKRYEASIVSLENTKDLSKITLAEVVHALQAQEQRRLMREDRVVEGALQAKHHDSGNSIKKNFKKNLPASNENGAINQNKGKGKGKITHLVSIAEKWVNRHSSVGEDQMQSAVSKISLDTKL